MAGRGGITGIVRFDKDRFFCEALPQIFSSFVRYDFLRRYFEVGLKHTNREIIDWVERERPRYVLWVAPSLGFQIMEETFDAIRAQGCTVIGWFWDDHAVFDSFTKLFIPHLDYCVTVALSAVEKYRELAVPFVYVPCAASPKVFRKMDAPYEYDVSFVGTKVADREELITAIEASELSIQKFGGGWNRFLPLEEMVQVFNASKINLNFAADVRNRDVKTLKARVFEICMCGGFLLTEYTEGLEDYFVLDKEVVCFREPEEARSKIKYYLSHDDEREQIASRGRERCLKEHTWLIRLNSVFEQLEREPVRGVSPVRVQESELHEAKLEAARFHLRWGKALLIAGHHNLARDEFCLARRYKAGSVPVHLWVSTFLPRLVVRIIRRMWHLVYIRRRVREVREFQENNHSKRC